MHVIMPQQLLLLGKDVLKCFTGFTSKTR